MPKISGVCGRNLRIFGYQKLSGIQRFESLVGTLFNCPIYAHIVIVILFISLYVLLIVAIEKILLGILISNHYYSIFHWVTYQFEFWICKGMFLIKDIKEFNSFGTDSWRKIQMCYKLRLNSLHAF